MLIRRRCEMISSSADCVTDERNPGKRMRTRMCASSDEGHVSVDQSSAAMFFEHVERSCFQSPEANLERVALRYPGPSTIAAAWAVAAPLKRGRHRESPQSAATLPRESVLSAVSLERVSIL